MYSNNLIEIKPNKNKEAEHSSLGADWMKWTTYAYAKKNELLLKQLSDQSNLRWIAASSKAVEQVLDFSAHLLETPNHLPSSQRFEHAGVSMAVDGLWDHLIKRGPALAVDVAGTIGKKASNSLESQIRIMESARQPGMVMDQKLEVLYEGLGFYELLKLPKAALDGMKDYSIASYYKIKNNLDFSKIKEHFSLKGTTPTSHAVKLLNQMMPPNAQSTLENYSNYLLHHVKSQNQGVLPANFSPLFQNAIQQCRIENKLTSEQTQLLSLYINSYSTTPSSTYTLKTKPDSAILRDSLRNLHQGIVKDLSAAVPEQSKIFQLIKSAAHQCTELALDIRKISNVQAFQARVQQTQIGISAVSSLGSQLAILSGKSSWAPRINAIGNGAHHWLGGASLLAAGHPVLGLLSLGSAFCSFASGFGGDDEDGIQVLSDQIHYMHRDMRQGFETVLLQQVQLATGLSQQIHTSHQVNMVRFDRVDTQLTTIQQQIVQSYQQLTQQQVYISQQVSQLSQQLSVAARNILQDLQLVHADLTHKLQTINQNLVQGVTWLDERVHQGFQHLDQEFHVQRVEQKSQQQHDVHNILQTQFEQQQILSQHTQQLYSLQSHSSIPHHEVSARKNRVQEEASHYAERVLQVDYPVAEIKPFKIEEGLNRSLKSSLSGGDSPLTPEGILTELGLEPNVIKPQDSINLLRHHACQLLLNPEEKQFANPLPHFPSWQKNIVAYLKWILLEGNATGREIEKLKTYGQQTRELLSFCHNLAQPEVIKKQFAMLAQEVETLGKSTQDWLLQEEQTILKNIQLRLMEQAVKQHKIVGYHLNTQDKEELERCFQERVQHIGNMQVQFMENTRIQYQFPLTHFVSPAPLEQLKYVLPLHTHQCPTILEPILALEALGAANIQFYYTYDKQKKQLDIQLEVTLSPSNKKLLLGKQSISCEEQGIQKKWRDFQWPKNQSISLSATEQTEITALLQENLQSYRLRLNKKLPQETQNHPQVRAIEAQIALVHAQYKLLFPAHYQEQHSLIHNILTFCFNKAQWQQDLFQYTGIGPHPYQHLLSAKIFYQELASNLIKALAAKDIYVENLEIENLLLLIDTSIMDLLPHQEKIAYLQTLIHELPETAKTSAHLLRGIWYEAQANIALAKEDYTQAVNLHPDDNQIRSKLAHVLYAQGNWSAVIEQCNIMLSAISEGIRATHEEALKKNLYMNHVALLSLRGSAYYNSHLFAAAAADYEQACELLPEQPELLYRYGLCCEQLGQHALAINHYREALKNAPNHSLSIYHLANCLVIEEKPVEALTYYQELIQQYPKSIEFQLKCVECGHEREQALNWLVEIVRNPEANIEQLLSCGELFLKKNDLAGALLACERVKKMNPNPEQKQHHADICLRIAGKKSGHTVYIPKLVLSHGLYKPRKSAQNQDSLSTLDNTQSI